MTSTAEPHSPADRQPGPGLHADAERNRERILHRTTQRHERLFPREGVLSCRLAAATCRTALVVVSVRPRCRELNHG
ncbi:hypothetical protein H4W80_007418 [Nonomuraea angiospora]|uniref:Uncharacterized protein n=1 Tax=Nonomuraea angiospora TaxID=46172 RepID=A0ABR9M8B9_9ACTN|nr:hypothetical protein [Nonomuraea angiospora]